MARMTLDQIRASQPKVNRAKVAAMRESDIAEHMRQDGEDPNASLGPVIEEVPPAHIREQIGMTPVEFAKTLQIPVATLRNWEQGRVRIDPAARALYALANGSPSTQDKLPLGCSHLRFAT